MVGSDGMGKGLESLNAGDAAQALAAMLQTQYLRYMIIASWAVGLLGVVGWRSALVWFLVTLAAGAVRSWFEKSMSGKVGARWGLLFPAVATVTTAAWAAAPLMAWFNGNAFGGALAVALLISGYVLVFAQLRGSPRQALVISSPYGAVAAVIAASLWGSPLFWSLLAVLPFTAAGLFVMVTMNMLREERIRAFQADQARLIEELETARDKANAASEAKSSFLGVVSHELRTPMNGVLGAAQLLGSTGLDQTQREYLSIIRNSGDSLLSLLNDILDMTKIEAGRMRFETVDIALDDLHQRVSSPFVALAEAKGVDLRCRFSGETPAVVRGDPLRVGQILQNLLSNAVKFTDSGAIDYEVNSIRLSDRRVRFNFIVADSGPGISEEDIGRLFQPFTQLDASSTRRFGGTGLGLTIARRMAHIMHGDIKVASTPGKGSTFTFTVEAEVVEWTASGAAVESVELTSEARSMDVLIVEDHPVNRMILEAWLNSAGHRTVAAENGQIAVELCADQRFDMIVMDVNMPVMDGLTATRLIRDAGANADTPIAVLSASARAEDCRAGLAAGADAYLTKPINFADLAELMVLAPGGRAAMRTTLEDAGVEAEAA
ncbi:MAG: ATP-binding protein [Brevundimonas sp.]|uniref:ATP-binding protein n=1 Tax=Brevundimonas sp. TaxID=1871086 RepID=UPI00403391CA